MRKCKNCGKEFDPTVNGRVSYCSAVCADEGDTARKKEYAERKKLQKDLNNDQPKKKRRSKYGREEKLVRFLADAREKGMTYAEAQVQETIQRVKDTGSSTINKDMIWG